MKNTRVLLALAVASLSTTGIARGDEMAAISYIMVAGTAGGITSVAATTLVAGGQPLAGLAAAALSADVLLLSACLVQEKDISNCSRWVFVGQAVVPTAFVVEGSKSLFQITSGEKEEAMEKAAREVALLKDSAREFVLNGDPASPALAEHIAALKSAAAEIQLGSVAQASDQEVALAILQIAN